MNKKTQKNHKWTKAKEERILGTEDKTEETLQLDSNKEKIMITACKNLWDMLRVQT